MSVDGKGRDFVGHWSWAGEKGHMNPKTAAAFGSATRVIMSLLDDWEEQSIQSLDVEKALRQFENLKKREYTPRSLQTYKSRFRRAVDSYLAYLKDPGNWKPPGLGGSSSNGAKAKAENRKSSSPGGEVDRGESDLLVEY